MIVTLSSISTKAARDILASVIEEAEALKLSLIHSCKYEAINRSLCRAYGFK